nr:bifunctional diguanylate cyclase/phosphodiesterase [Arcobacter vandammei]
MFDIQSSDELKNKSLGDISINLDLEYCDNQEFYIDDKSFKIQNIKQENNLFILIFHDISHEIEHKKELNKLLFTDNLTKLPNRAKLIDSLQNDNISPESIVLLNINSFKEINDFYGHKAGDKILISVANQINDYLKDLKDIRFYKFPTDNYCIINMNYEKNDLINLVEIILKNIDDTIFYFENYEIDVNLRAGLSFSNKNNKLITADIALQSAKNNNKSYEIFYDELDKFQEYENNMLWTRKLKNAFLKDSIEVFYQPLIDNKTGEVHKYECLVRMIEDDGKVIAPFFFLEVSKKSNQYTKLTKVVIEKAFKKFSTLHYEFSVNISYDDIEKEDFLDFIKEMLLKYGVNDKVIFEILEDENIKNYSTIISFIDEIKNLGCKVAIDDFGSGYSNFEHILKMNADYLKIDASIIKNIVKDENSYKITKTIIEFAKSLNLKTIAEYVENEEIFNIVKNLGADYSQGYYFSPPIAEPNFK